METAKFKLKSSVNLKFKSVHFCASSTRVQINGPAFNFMPECKTCASRLRCVWVDGADCVTAHSNYWFGPIDIDHHID